MFAGKSGAGKHLVWKLSKIVEDTNNLGLRIGETSNVGVKNFNVQRLDNARASPLLYLAVGDILVVWLVLDKNFNLFKMILTLKNVKEQIKHTQSPGFAGSELPKVATYLGNSLNSENSTPAIK